MTNEQDQNVNPDSSEQTHAEKKENHVASGRKVEHKAVHLKDTENPKGHQFDPSRRTTNK